MEDRKMYKKKLVTFAIIFIQKKLNNISHFIS